MHIQKHTFGSSDLPALVAYRWWHLIPTPWVRTTRTCQNALDCRIYHHLQTQVRVSTESSMNCTDSALSARFVSRFWRYRSCRFSFFACFFLQCIPSAWFLFSWSDFAWSLSRATVAANVEHAQHVNWGKFGSMYMIYRRGQSNNLKPHHWS